MKTLQVAIIGAGHIFWLSHQKNLAQIEGVQIAAICDPSEESRKRAEAELSVRTYQDIESMLNAEHEIDALLNFSPAFVRPQAIQAAITRKLPIFVEKPVAATTAEAQKILGLLQCASVPVSVGFMFRYMPAVDRMQELLAGKKIIHAYSEFFCPALTQWNMAKWFLKKEISGGPVVDQAIHLLDLLRYFVGDMEAVASFPANVLYPQDSECTIEDSSSTILKFKNGVTGAHLQSWVHDRTGGGVTIRTEHDCLTLDTEGNLSGYVGDEKVSFELPEAEVGRNDHQREMVTFLNAVRSGDFSQVRSDVADAARSLAVAEAVNASMAAGTFIDVKEVS